VVDARRVARAPIVFRGRDGSTQHAPLVAGSIEGFETLLVLDTGSDVHLLNKELVDRIGLGTEPGEDGVDHSGRTMPSWSVEQTPLALGGAELALYDVVSIPAPAPFPAMGIGGILSPQHLHPTAVAVVDLGAGELVLVEGDDGAIAAWIARRAPERATLTLRRDPAYATPVVAAAIEPFAELPVLLNTGGKGTEFAAGAVPGIAAAAPQRLGGGVSGADVLGGSAGPRTLLVDGHRIAVSSLAVRDSMHDPQGMVGMDVLRGTAVACAADRARPVVWQL
jgi:Aspartyl protease